MNHRPKQTYMYFGPNHTMVESDDPHFRPSDLDPNYKPKMLEWDSTKRKFVSKRKQEKCHERQ